MSFAAFCGALSATAQDITGSISGTVQDAQSKAIPGATVTLTNIDKNIVVRTVKADDKGDYVAALLPIGRYLVTAEAPGFKKVIHTGVVLNVNDKLTINLKLEVGDVTETLTIEATALQVDTQTATGAGVISGAQVRELPINNRNYEQLVSLMPGVAINVSDQIYIGVSNPLGTSNQINFSIDGNRPTANNWTVDGADNVDRGANLTLLTYPSVDAIAEFKVLRNNYDAEFGRGSAAQISVVTKSGEHNFHGDLYEFFRNDVLSANSFFSNANAIPRKPLRYNDFGGTIGGPIYIPGHYNTDRKKTFFFFSEELRRVITYTTFLATVPTSAEKVGTFLHPVCVAFNSNGSCAPGGTSTTVTNIDPIAAQYIKDIWSKIPDPQTGHSLTTPQRNLFNATQEIIKLDHIIGPKLTLSGRFENDSIPTQEPGGLFTGSPLPGVATTSTNAPGRSLGIRGTSTLTSSILNEVGYLYSYGAVLSDPIGLINPANSPDIKPTLPFTSVLHRVPAVSISGGGSGIFGFGQYRDFNRNHNVYDNLTKTWGRQTWKFGVSYHHYEKSENSAGSNAGQFTFRSTGRPPAGTPNRPSVFEQAWANFLQGRVDLFNQASLDLTPDINTNTVEFYGQDEIRLKPNLTVTLGLRYSRFLQPFDNNGHLTNFDPALYSLANAPQIDTNGNRVPNTGDPLNGVIIAGKNSPFGNKVTNEDNLNFAPRIGIAWDPFKNGRTAIRAGYGIFYDPTTLGLSEFNVFTNPPFVQSVNIPATQFGNPAAGTPSVSLRPTLLNAMPLPYHTPYLQQWNLDLQRELMRNLIVDIGYVGNKATHLFGQVDINELKPGVALAHGFGGSGIPITGGNTIVLNQFRPFLGYDAFSAVEAEFNSNYNSLQVAVQKKFSGNSLISAAYTYSHALTDNQTENTSAPQNTYCIHCDYGASAIDRRHIFTANYVYELPWLRNQEGLVGHFFGGWEISGIVSYSSGRPFTVFTFDDFDPAGLGILDISPVTPRPDFSSDPNVNAPHTVGQWFNTSVFVEPNRTGAAGTAPRSFVRGPGFGRWDFSIFKNTRITESTRLQFRAETFNVFNHTNFDNLSRFVGSSTFGRVTATRDPRIMQLAMKFYF